MKVYFNFPITVIKTKYFSIKFGANYRYWAFRWYTDITTGVHIILGPLEIYQHMFFDSWANDRETRFLNFLYRRNIWKTRNS